MQIRNKAAVALGVVACSVLLLLGFTACANAPAEKQATAETASAKSNAKQEAGPAAGDAFVCGQIYSLLTADWRVQAGMSNEQGEAGKAAQQTLLAELSQTMLKNLPDAIPAPGAEADAALAAINKAAVSGDVDKLSEELYSAYDFCVQEGFPREFNALAGEGG